MGTALKRSLDHLTFGQRVGACVQGVEESVEKEVCKALGRGLVRALMHFNAI